VQRKGSKGLRDAAAKKIVESRLTEAALRHHESQSTVGSRERRQGSRGGSKGGSINDTELVFEKHDVPQMPFRSEVESGLTRDSLLSQESETTAAAHHGEVPRASLQPAEPKTPVRASPNQDFESDEEQDEDHYQEDPSIYDSHDLSRNFEPPHGDYNRGRALSPIQSVASDRDEEDYRQSEIPILSREDGAALSIESLSSAPSTNLARSTRAATTSTDKQDHDERGVELGYELSSPQGSQDRDWNHDDNDHDRYASHEVNGAFEDDERRMTNYTQDGYDEEAYDGRDSLGKAAFVRTPVAVESDVASLLDPSVVDRNSTASAKDEFTNERPSWSPHPSIDRNSDTEARSRGSPLKQSQEVQPTGQSFQKRMGVTSPPQSVALSSSDDLHDKPLMLATGVPTAGSPIPEIGLIPDSEESELNTNPSIIQGPIGGVAHENRDHWPYDPTPPRPKGSPHSEDDEDQDRHFDEPTTGLGVTTDPTQGAYYAGTYQPHTADKGAYGIAPAVYTADYSGITSPVKDEGYISAANQISTSTVTPELKGKQPEAVNDVQRFASPADSDEDFHNTSHNRHLSGYSHGMGSPLYDSATGRGIDRIQSKDIVALMDHVCTPFLFIVVRTLSLFSSADHCGIVNRPRRSTKRSGYRTVGNAGAERRRNAKLL
jgi:hypothetical protein